MTWFQAAHDADAFQGYQWVVLQIHYHSRYGMTATEVSRWPTRHEAEGHARKAWERLR